MLKLNETNNYYRIILNFNDNRKEYSGENVNRPNEPIDLNSLH